MEAIDLRSEQMYAYREITSNYLTPLRYSCMTSDTTNIAEAVQTINPIFIPASVNPEHALCTRYTLFTSQTLPVSIIFIIVIANREMNHFFG